MPEVTIEHQPTLDLLATSDPALSTTSDIPKVETKPDSQPAPKEEKPEAKVEAAPDEGKKPADSAPAEQPDEDAAANAEPEKKPAKGVQKRIDELVRQREEAERRAEAERQEKLRLLALVEGKTEKPKPAEVEEEQEPQEPTRAEFQTPEDYDAALRKWSRDLASWTANRAVRNAREEDARATHQRQIEESAKAAQTAYQERVSKAAEKYADYKEVAESPNVTVTVAMAQAILHSQHGPEIQYFLGKNPGEAKRISTLNPAEQLVELGRITATLQAPTKEAPEKPKPVVSSAPKPIKPLESKSEPVAKSPDEESMEEYAARRNKELQAERRPGHRP